MSRLIFMFAFVFVFFMMNYYFIGRLLTFFISKKTFIVYSIIFLFTVLFPISMSLNRMIGNTFTKYFYTLGSIWLGILTIGIGILFIFEIINRLVRIKFPSLFTYKYVGIGLIVLIFGLSFYAVYNASRVVVKYENIPISGLKSPKSVIYLSDVHIDSIHDMSYLKSIVNQINSINADFVIINGDFVDGTSFAEKDFKILNEINKDVYFTYGNHEGYVGKEFVTNLLNQTKVKILENDIVQKDGIQLIGLQDMHGFDEKANHDLLNQLLSSIQIDSQIPSILVLHEPIGPHISAKYGIDLQVAGHTHNGQIFPFMFFVKRAFPYIKGLYKIQDMYLYVGTGTGTWGPPMRLGSQSIITLLNLQPK